MEFASKAAKHKKFKTWFKQVNLEQIAEKARFAESKTRLRRLGANSPIPYFTKLLNKKNGY